MNQDYIGTALVLLSGCSILVFLGSLAAYRPVVFVCFSFIIFTFVWRTFSSMYVDIAGPLLASQIERYIGPGIMTVFQSVAYFLTLMPFLWLFQPDVTHRWAALYTCPPSISRPVLTISDFTVALSVLLLVLLFATLVIGGVIPILAKIERWTFNEQYSGAIHHFIIERGDLVCFWWGTMFVAEKIRRKRYDYRYLALLVTLLIYMFLVGGRFSPFYRFGSFFIMPFAAIVALHGRVGSGEAYSVWRSVLPNRRILATGIGIVGLTTVLICFALYWNLTKVRGFEGTDAQSAFIQRIAIQPTELGWQSYRRVLVDGEWDPRKAFDFLFQRPIEGGRNTTPQYLMSQTIGEPRTTEHILSGFQFAGGFPEIFFELFGPFWTWLLILAVGWLCAVLSAITVRSIISGRYFTAALAFYVLFGFYVMYIGGMVNFAVAPTYWAKVLLLLVALFLERKRPLMPWVLLDSERIQDLKQFCVSVWPLRAPVEKMTR